MSEKFNSGMGGYTCDTCLALLWAGHRGSTEKANRIYCYLTKEENIVEYESFFFCSNDCLEKYLTQNNENEDDQI